MEEHRSQVVQTWRDRKVVKQAVSNTTWMNQPNSLDNWSYQSTLKIRRRQTLDLNCDPGKQAMHRHTERLNLSRKMSDYKFFYSS